MNLCEELQCSEMKEEDWRQKLTKKESKREGKDLAKEFPHGAKGESWMKQG